MSVTRPLRAGALASGGKNQAREAPVALEETEDFLGDRTQGG